VIIRRFFVFLPLLVLLLLAGTWYWLLHTQSGARWIWAQVESATGNALSATDIGEVSLSADVDLLPLSATILPAHVSDLRIELRGDKETDDESDLRETFAKLQLPVELIFTDVELERGAIDWLGEDRSVVVDTLSLAGRWKDMWFVERFSLESALVSAKGNGNFELFDDNELQLEAELALPGELTGLDDTLLINTTLQGPLDGLLLQARTEEPRMHLRGRVSNITDALSWEALLDVPALDLPASRVRGQRHADCHRGRRRFKRRDLVQPARLAGCALAGGRPGAKGEQSHRQSRGIRHAGRLDGRRNDRTRRTRVTSRDVDDRWRR
jgi:hypothetical protein